MRFYSLVRRPLAEARHLNWLMLLLIGIVIAAGVSHVAAVGPAIDRSNVDFIKLHKGALAEKQSLLNSVVGSGKAIVAADRGEEQTSSECSDDDHSYGYRPLGFVFLCFSVGATCSTIGILLLVFGFRGHVTRLTIIAAIFCQIVTVSIACLAAETLLSMKPYSSLSDVPFALRGLERFVIRSLCDLLKDDYDTRIGDRGAGLSAGPQQRVALAHPLPRSPGAAA
jgi:hypothetical protein